MRQWRGILTRAGIADLRIHDLRRSLGSCRRSPAHQSRWSVRRWDISDRKLPPSTAGYLTTRYGILWQPRPLPLLRLDPRKGASNEHCKGIECAVVILFQNGKTRDLGEMGRWWDQTREFLQTVEMTDEQADLINLAFMLGRGAGELRDLLHGNGEV